MKKFIEWLKRINYWFLKPSALSLLISLFVPVFFGFSLWVLAHDFPEYFSQFFSMMSESEFFSYEFYIIVVFVIIYGLCWSSVNWFFDLIKYICSKFFKSSAAADDK